MLVLSGVVFGTFQRLEAANEAAVSLENESAIIERLIAERQSDDSGRSEREQLRLRVRELSRALSAGESVALSPHYYRCMDEAVFGMHQRRCIRREAERSDSLLSSVYRQAEAAIEEHPFVPDESKAEWRTALQKSQENWLAYREAECKDAKAFVRWMAHDLAFRRDECLALRTTARLQELRAAYRLPDRL